MSDIITSGAVHSELALAAYANLDKGVPILANLVKAGMTQAEADAFSKEQVGVLGSDQVNYLKYCN